MASGTAHQPGARGLGDRLWDVQSHQLDTTTWAGTLAIHLPELREVPRPRWLCGDCFSRWPLPECVSPKACWPPGVSASSGEGAHPVRPNLNTPLPKGGPAHQPALHTGRPSSLTSPPHWLRLLSLHCPHPGPEPALQATAGWTGAEQRVGGCGGGAPHPSFTRHPPSPTQAQRSAPKFQGLTPGSPPCGLSPSTRVWR